MYSFQHGCDYEFMATMRMSPDVYRELKRLVYPIIYRQDTHYRVSITPTERLSLTLRYLAHGEYRKQFQKRIYKLDSYMY